MVFMSRAIILGLLACLAWAKAGVAVAASKDFLTLLPFTHVAVTPKAGIQVAFFLPCGTSYQGAVLVQNADHPDVLQMAILVRQESLLCASLPKPEKVVLRAVAGIRKVEPMAIPLGRMNFVLADLLDISAKKRSKAGLQVLFEDNCAQQLGMVIDDRDDDVLKVGVLGALKMGSKTKCPYAQKIQSAPYVTGRGRALHPLQMSTQDLERAYYLRVVAANDVFRSSRVPDEMVVNYTRTCQDAPIGPIIAQSASEKLLRVGILVARFYNRRCQLGHGIDDHMRLQEVAIPRNFLLQPLAVKIPGGQRLTITSPQRYAVGQPDATTPGIVLDYMASCREPIGVVYARDFAENLSVGIVQLEELSQCRGTSRPAMVSQPLFPSSEQSGKIYPMRLTGFRYL